MESVVPNIQPGLDIVIDYIGGDLDVTGRAGAGVRADGDDPRIQIEDDGKRVRISCDGDCELRVPEDARVSIEDIGGDANITHVNGAVVITSVGGDLTIRDTGAVRLQSVGGDLELKRVSGNVEVTDIGGDANFKDVGGELRVDSVGGDAAMANIEKACSCKTIGSDFAFNLDFEPGAHYRLSVGGDVLGELSSDANVRFVVPAETEVYVDLAGVQLLNNGEQRVITVGTGAATVEFDNIGGDFRLTGPGKGGFESAEGGFSFSFADDIGDIISARVAEQIAPILDNVKRQTERIQREVERNAERARERRPGSWTFGWSSEKTKRGMPPTPPVPPVPPTPPAWAEKPKCEPVQPVTDEERMAILRMVESKQISVEEAEKLLAALEGSD